MYQSFRRFSGLQYRLCIICSLAPGVRVGQLFFSLLLKYSCFTIFSSVQRSESAIHIHDALFLGFPSHSGHHGVLSRAPCATQQVLTSDLFHTIAWRIPGTGAPGRLPSLGSRRVGHD